MHVLITRPEADAAALVVPLEEMGHRVSLAPMIEVSFDPVELLTVDNISGFIATSRNGIRGLDHQRARVPETVFELPCYAVGEATARYARTIGFKAVIEGPAAARDLVGVIKALHADKARPLVHLAGDVLAFDMKSTLMAAGFAVREHVVYSTRACEELPSGVSQDLASGKIDAVVVMSPRTGETFSRLVAAAGLAPQLRTTALVCLSQAVAEAVAPLASERMVIAAKPNLRETLLAIANLTEQFR